MSKSTPPAESDPPPPPPPPPPHPVAPNLACATSPATSHATPVHNVQINQISSVGLAAINLPALDTRPAVLGSLYDAKVEKFCHALLIDESSPSFSSSRKTLMVPNTEIKLILNDNYETKFSTLGIPPQIQLGILTGLIPLDNGGSSSSWDILRVTGLTGGPKINSSTSLIINTGYLVFTMRTVNEELNILNAAAAATAATSNGINLEILNHSNATHVVSTVKWGLRLIVQVIYGKSENSKNEEGTEDDTHGGVKVKEFLEKITQLLTSDENDDLVKSKVKKGLKNLADNKFGNKFTIRFHGDLIPPENKMPNTVPEALEILGGLRGWRKILDKINSGKGLPLQYELVSLAGLEKIFKTNFTISKSLGHVITEDPRTVPRIVQKFDKIELVQRQLEELFGEVQMFQNFLDPARQVQWVTQLKRNFDEERAQLENQLKLTLLNIKMNGWTPPPGEGPERMEKILKNYTDSPHSDVKILDIFTTDDHLRGMREKIKILKFLQTKNVLLVARGEDVQFKIHENMAKKIAVVLWAVQNFFNKEDPKWEENFQTFLYMLSDKSREQRFVFVDGEFHENLKEMKKMTGSRILMFEQSKLIIDDALETLAEGDRMREQMKKFGENKFVWTIDNFSVKMKLAKEKKKLFLYSEPFYMNKYKFKAQVYLNGHDPSTSNHMSVYVLTLPGFADNLVTWPFTQEIYMTLLPQNSQKNGGHVQIVTSAKFPDLFKRQFDANAARGSGYAKFVTHPVLLHGEGNFLKDDKILIEFRL